MPPREPRNDRSPGARRLALPGIALLILAAAVAIPSFGAPTAAPRASGVKDIVNDAKAAAGPRPEQLTLGSTGPVLSGETFTPARALVFLAGTHTGYQFDATGAVTTSKAATLTRSSSAATDQRAVIVERDGTWFHVTNGIWAGYWLRESPVLYLPGVIGQQNFSPTRTVSFAAGTHTGYLFGPTGGVTAVRPYTLTRS